MTVGSSNRTAIRRIKETTFGNIPTTPALIDTRYTGEGLNYSIENITSNEIRSDRQTSDLVQVSSDAAGNIDFELSYASYDDLIQAALYAGDPTVVNFTSNQLEIVDSGGDMSLDRISGGPDLSTQNIVVGMYISFSGWGNTNLNNAFKVTSISADSIGLDNSSGLLQADNGGDDVTVQGNMWRNGVTRESFTLQKHFQDVTPNVFVNFFGCVVNQMSLEVSTGSIVTGSFDLQGLGAQSPTESQIVGATTVDSTTSTPMNAVNNVVNIIEDGVTSTNKFSTLSLSINNNNRTLDAVGSLQHIDVKAGRLDITGSVSVYFENKSAYEKFINGTQFSLSFKIQNPASTQGYIITLPRVKYSGGSVVSGGLDSDIIFEAEISAIADLTTNSMIQIDKV